MTERVRQLRDEWRPSAITLGTRVFPLLPTAVTDTEREPHHAHHPNRHRP
jgi:hypothetical protein